MKATQKLILKESKKNSKHTWNNNNNKKKKKKKKKTKKKKKKTSPLAVGICQLYLLTYGQSHIITSIFSLSNNYLDFLNKIALLPFENNCGGLH